MENYAKQDMEEALKAIASMIHRSEKAQERFEQGTAHYALQKNRIKALTIASSLIKKALAQSGSMEFSKEDLEDALMPLASLIHKSEKAREKLTEGTWQHTMLGDNLKALYMASPLLIKVLREIDGECLN